MKNSEKNLMVLENFILHITHSSEGDYDANDSLRFTANELYQMARDYIEEDHVDGQENPDEILQNRLNKLAECISLDQEEDNELEEAYEVLIEQSQIDGSVMADDVLTMWEKLEYEFTVNQLLDYIK